MKNPKVEFYFTNALSKNKWYLEIEKLRTIIIELNLQEELKWGCPCYTDNGSNIILIHVFKEYCALLFFKGALHKNADGSLIQQTKNVQSARQMRFTTVQEISKKESSIKANIKEAIAIEKAGLKVELAQPKDIEFCEEFDTALRESKSLKKAFEALTPGRQRAYHLHFSAAKQSKTREARIEKCIPLILDGKGLNE